ncbi:MAG: hypothetical protein KF723_07780 [Rhizobiaceae bacterium]|nr:hypothetical protein [Rhizobiaceae bacterium]
MTLPSRIAALLLALALAACQSAQQSAPPASSGKSAALRTMEQVATAAHKCWFASGDKAFKPYRFANELNSMTGNPRFLLVPAKNFGGLPALVVQASGNSTRVDTFGPLLSEPLGARVSADIARWSAGSTDCGAGA